MKPLTDITPQGIAVHFLELDGWEIVIREVDLVGMMRRGTARSRTAFAEVLLDGTVRYVADPSRSARA